MLGADVEGLPSACVCVCSSISLFVRTSLGLDLQSEEMFLQSAEVVADPGSCQRMSPEMFWAVCYRMNEFLDDDDCSVVAKNTFIQRLCLTHSFLPLNMTFCTEST